MNETNNLVYFLNSIKDLLPFEDEQDFINKIKENKDFRIKVQKLVYLSKYFGWKNSYIFTLNVNGPYSINLADNYNNKNLLNIHSIEIPTLNIDAFINFIKDKPIDFLEVVATILYVFKNKKASFNKENSISALNELKPHINDEIKVKAYDEIIKLDLINKITNKYSLGEINTLKTSLKLKINKIQDQVEPLETCRNNTLILGSLEYMNVVMRIEQIEIDYKKDLMEFIDYYVNKLESILLSLNSLLTVDLTLFEDLFDQFQDYVSNELKIIPRVDDENFDYADYY